MKKRKYSKEQQLYLVAKANLKIAEKEEKDADRQYILERGIINPDGTIPECIYCIDDEETFNAANEEYGKNIEDSEIWQNVINARKLLKEAEANLLDYALNVVPIPKKEKDTLTKGVKIDYTTRSKIIDLIMNLDVSTLPKNLVLR